MNQILLKKKIKYNKEKEITKRELNLIFKFNSINNNIANINYKYSNNKTWNKLSSGRKEEVNNYSSFKNVYFHGMKIFHF